MNKDQ